MERIMSPAVSIIMPCYNHQDFVGEALGSALSQTLSDIEIIAIDDKSGDHTLEVLRGCDDPRLTVIEHSQNRGSAKTINEGIRRARGDYVSILNSDDVYHPERLKYCLETAEEHDFYLVSTDIDLQANPEEVSLDRKNSWLKWYGEIKSQYLESQDLKTTLLLGNLFITTSNFFCRRNLFNAIGPIADYRYVQDYDFALRATVAYPRKVHWSEHRMLAYRLHEANTIEEDDVEPNQQTLEVLTRWMPHLIGGKEGKARLKVFEDHVLKLASYIESGSANQVHRQWQADVANYKEVVEKGSRDLALLDQQKREEFDRVQAELSITQERSAQLESELSVARSELDLNQKRLDTAQSEIAETASELLASRKKEEASSEYNRMLETQRDTLSRDLAEHQEVLQLMSTSWSYRLGYAVFQPLRLVRHLYRILTRSTSRSEKTAPD